MGREMLRVVVGVDRGPEGKLGPFGRRPLRMEGRRAGKSRITKDLAIKIVKIASHFPVSCHEPYMTIWGAVMENLNGLDAAVAPQIVSALESAAEALWERLGAVRDLGAADGGEEYRRVRHAPAITLALRRRPARAAEMGVGPEAVLRRRAA